MTDDLHLFAAGLGVHINLSGPRELCSASRGTDHCDRERAGTLVTGCVHEHIHRSPVCLPCLVLLREMARGGLMICTACSLRASPHECVISEITWEPL